MKTGPKARPLQERFWEKVEFHKLPELCWQYNGSCNPLGYGIFMLQRRPVRKRISAPRFAWEAFNGPISEGLEIDHLCRNPRCVNPRHLEPVTHKENLSRAPMKFDVGADQRAQTYCKHGHAFDETNTYFRPEGGRTCRKCNNEITRRYRARKHSRQKTGDLMHENLPGS